VWSGPGGSLSRISFTSDSRRSRRSRRIRAHRAWSPRTRLTAFVTALTLTAAGLSAPFAAAAAAAEGMPATPLQQSGTAAGRSHSASAASTTATRGAVPGSGAVGRAPGALPEYLTHARPAVPVDSGSRVHQAPKGKSETLKTTGFDPANSVEVPALDTADSIVYRNPDGTYTSHVYTHAVNQRGSQSGTWQRIAGSADPLAPKGTTAAAVSANTDSGGNNTTTGDTYVESGVSQNFAGNGTLYVGQYQNNDYNSFLQFSGFQTQFPNAYVVGASLELDTEYTSPNGSGCAAEAVDVAPVSVPWSPTALTSYPGPATGAQIGTASFAAGINCSNGRAWEGIPLSTNQTLMNWAHGWAPNYGLAVTAPLDPWSGKEFYANDAYLAVTYTPNGEGAKYAETTYASPWNNAPGYGVVTVQNEGSATWTPTNGFKLSYEIYTLSGTTMTLDTAVTPGATSMPSTVAPNSSVTVTSPIVALTPGPTYEVCWDMENGTTKFSSLGVPPVCYSLPVVNNPPVITAYSPDNNAGVFTLTPTLGVAAYDPDNYPNKGLRYSFQVFPAGSATAVASASNLATSTWAVPAGKLSYASTYYWEAQVSDTVTSSAWSAPDYFSVAGAPQPLVTSQLGVPDYGSTVHGVDPQVGNFSTVVTDANYAVPDFGPPVQVKRTYNSLNPAGYNAFGAGWASILDMRVTPDSDGSGNVVLTLADGQQERFGLNGDGTFSAPAGAGGILLNHPLPGYGSVGDGYTYIDPSGVRYNFIEGATDPITGQDYVGLANAWDANGHGVDLTWLSQTLSLPDGSTTTMNLPVYLDQEADGQNTTHPDNIGDLDNGTYASLQYTWGVAQVVTQTGSTVDVPHVTAVNVGAYFLQGIGPQNPWSYGYNASDELTSVCPPASLTTTSTSCSTYAYTSGATSGSHFASMVLSANPTEYWRLDDAVGSGTAADSVAVNEGSDNATLHDVSLGQPGALAGSPATSASFNGTDSVMTLPPNMMATTDNPTVSMWFKTTQAGGTLFSYQGVAPGTATSANYTPSIYVGSDGKLRAEFWDGTASPMTSTAAVDDGKWHFVVLTGNDVTQTLFVDGAQVATRSGGTISESGQSYDTVGAGEIGNWPAAPSGNELGYFNGDLEDVNFLQHPLGLPEVQQEYASGINAAVELTQTTAPSGKVQNTLQYNALTDRATSVTDSDGGTYAIGVPSTSGSDNYYYGAMQSTRPALDYPMNDSTGLVAVDRSGTDDPPGAATDGTYNDVMLGEPGIFGVNGDTAAGFNGSDSYMSLPSGAFKDSSGNASVALWFTTRSTGGVLFSYQQGVIGVASSGASTPALYIGGDGKLYGEFWDGKVAPMVSAGAVDDGNWHLVAMTATGTTQTLYLDGTQIATRSGNSIAGVAESTQQNTVTVGAGYVASGWPNPPSNPLGYFNGEIAQVGLYQIDIDQTTPTAAASLYQARGSAKALTPTTTVSVTDPSKDTETYTFDPTENDRATSYTNALGQTTTYAYDTLGFQDASTDPDGHTMSRQHDRYGNVVETTNCQSQNSCQTSYFSFYEDTANQMDPLNGKVLAAADARAGSAGTSNPAFTTHYTYTPDGEIASVTTPPTAASPRGQTTTYEYYVGTEDNGTEPYGMLRSVTDPRGETTSYTYEAPGLVARETDPSGLQKTFSYDWFNNLDGECIISDTYPLTTDVNGATVCPQEYSYTYEPDNQVATETYPAVTDAVTGATHTRETTYTYDVDGNLISRADSDGANNDATRTTTYTYNAANRQASVTDALGNVTSYTYDDYGNLITRALPNGADYAYTYTPTGLQLTATLTNWTGNPNNPSAATSLVTDSRAYDPAGRLASDTDAMGRTTSYTYFDNDLIATETRASGTSSAVTTSYTYDAAGNMTSQCVGQSPSGCTNLTDYAVNALNQTTQTTSDPSGVDQTVTDHYDPDGNVLSQILSGGGQNRLTSYTYDAAGDRTAQTVATANDGPAGYWPLSDGAATVAADATGYGNPAMASGGVSWGAPGTGAATFNGTNGYLATKSAVLNTDPTSDGYTVAAWVKLSSASSTADGTVVSQDGVNTSAFQLEYNHTAKSWALVMPSNDAVSPTTVYTAADPAPAQTGAWTFVVGEWTPAVNFMTLYVNNVVVSGVAAQNGSADVQDPTPFASSGPTAIGRGRVAGAAANFFPGQIRDVQVFQHNLTDAQLTDLYQAGVGGDSQSPVVLGAAGFWKLDDGESAAGADASGYGNAAVLGGDSHWSADSGGALVTDGTAGGGASTPGPVIGTTGDFTVSAWAKLNTAGTGWQTVLTQQAGQAGGFSLDYDGATGRWAFDRAATDTASPTLESAQSTAAPTLGAWTHLTGVYTAATGAMRLYVNGVAQGTASDPTPIASNGPVDIGRGYSAGAAANSFNGEIRDVQMYGRVLTAAEVATLAAGGTAGSAPSTTTWTYDQRGEPTTSVSPDGNVAGAHAADYTTTYTFDQLGEQTSISSPPVSFQSGGSAPATAVATRLAGYDTFGDLVETSDPTGNITTATYNVEGEKTAVSQPSYTPPGSATAITPTTTYTYDAMGEPASVTDALGNTTQYTYDQLGHAVKLTAPGNEVAEKTYDTDGETLSTTSPTGAVNQATYNPLGEMVTTTAVERYPSAQAYTTSYSYDALGDQTSVRYPQGDSTTAAFNALGERMSSTNGLNETTKFAYGLGGQLVRTTAPDGSASTRTYDAAGRETGTSQLGATGSVLAAESFGYDAAGNRTSATDALGATTTSTYNALNELTSQTQPATSATHITTSFGHDADGHTTAYTDPNGNTTVYTYNTLGLEESEVAPTVTGYTSAADSTTTIAYDADARPAVITEPGGVSITDTYDVDGNLTGQSGTGAEAATTSTTFGYDLANQMTSYSAPGGTNTITYDDRGLPIAASGPSGAITNVYDGDMRLTSRTDATGTSTFTYNNGGETTSQSDPLTGVSIGFTYNNLDQTTGVTYGTGGSTETLSYNAQHQLAGDTIDNPSGAVEASISYQYNVQGEITNETTTGTAGAGSSTYTYDEAGRLTSDTSNGADTAYAYDPAGNLTGNGSAHASYNARDQLTSVVNGSNTTNYGYTARGTLASTTTGSSTTNYADNAFGQQVSAGSSTYTYDSLGRTATASTGGTTYAFSYDGVSSAAVSDGTELIGRTAGGSPVSEAAVGAAPGSGQLLDVNQHGDVVGTFTPTGAALTGSTQYTPWGQPSSGTGTAVHLGFQGGWTDPGTGLVDANARWYDPATGGFTSRDTANNAPSPAVAANPFAYANDNPLINADPTGHDACTENDSKWQAEQKAQAQAEQEAAGKEVEQEMIQQSEEQFQQEMKIEEAKIKAGEARAAEEQAAEEQEMATDEADFTEEEAKYQESLDESEHNTSADESPEESGDNFDANEGRHGEIDSEDGSDVTTETDPAYSEAGDQAAADSADAAAAEAEVSSEAAADAGGDALLEVAGEAAGEFLADYGIEIGISLVFLSVDPSCGAAGTPGEPTTPTEPPATSTEPVQAVDESTVPQQPAPSTDGPTANSSAAESTTTETGTTAEGESGSESGPASEPRWKPGEAPCQSKTEYDANGNLTKFTPSLMCTRAAMAGVNGLINAVTTAGSEVNSNGKPNWGSVLGAFTIGAATGFAGSKYFAGKVSNWSLAFGSGAVGNGATDILTQALSPGKWNAGETLCNTLEGGAGGLLGGAPDSSEAGGVMVSGMAGIGSSTATFLLGIPRHMGSVSWLNCNND
jgi:RHS repeat-associated protein